MTDNQNEVIEVIARIICAQQGSNPDDNLGSLGGLRWTLFTGQAKELIDGVVAAGLRFEKGSGLDDDLPETMIGLFIKQLNAKLADKYRNLTVENKELKKRIETLERIVAALPLEEAEALEDDLDPSDCEITDPEAAEAVRHAFDLVRKSKR
jgi:polyhydroxyalkanoate synthesis regulator phasin